MAAVIGVGGTVIVGVVGFWATVRTTGKTIHAARDSRIWDKRAEVYVEAIGAVYFRQKQREYDTRIHRMDDDASRREPAYLAAYTLLLIRAGSRLLAFGSQRVIEVLRESSAAHLDALGAFLAWQAADDKTKADNDARDPGIPVPVTPDEADRNIGLHTAQLEERRAADSLARRVVDSADGELIEFIRAELQERRRTPVSQWKEIMLPGTRRIRPLAMAQTQQLIPRGRSIRGWNGYEFG